MNAPSIPNLLSLGGGRGARGRGRGGRGGSSSNPAARNATVQSTDTDAAVSRMSAVDLGYLKDPYAQYFVSSENRYTRRLPIINRGTYMRTTKIDELIEVWDRQYNDVISTNCYRTKYPGDHPYLDHPQEFHRQIISLGAGTDTRPFRFIHQNPDQVIYHEIDFPEIMDKKSDIVNRTPELRHAIEPKICNYIHKSVRKPLKSSELRFHGLDLRDLARDDNPPDLPGLIADIPTILISECCLCYLETEHAKKVIKYFKDRILELSIIIYEPIRPDDAFGKQMVSNLAVRGIRMPTLESYKEPADQRLRIEEAGIKDAGALTVDQVWDLVDPKEKERVDQLEGLDEVEEWKLLAGHYVIAYGAPGSDIIGLR